MSNYTGESRKVIKVTLFKGDGGTTEEYSTEQYLSTILMTTNSSSGEAADLKDESVEPAKAAETARSTNNIGEEIRIQTIPVLSFNFFSLNTLWRLLKSPSQYSGLILTSPRCIESLEKCMEEELPTLDAEKKSFVWNNTLKDAWKSKLIFCVGPSTVSRFESFIKSNNCPSIIMSKDGNAKSLGESIVQEHMKTAIQLPLLYPCGTLKRDTLGNILTEAKISFECVTVYQTIQNPDLIQSVAKLNADEEDVKNSTKEELHSVYVFYSPSGVNHAVPLLKDIGLKYIVAIGPTTKEALEKVKEISPKKLYQCSAPTNEALAIVLNSIKYEIYYK